MDPYGRQKTSSSRVPLLFGVLAVLSLLYNVYWIFSNGPKSPEITKAIVVLKGDSSVSGTVIFEQAKAGSPVKITGSIKGLDPNALRGFHIHAAGDLSSGCLSAGPHFNPFGKTHGAPEDAARHVGDLGNIKSDSMGEANFLMTDKQISLNGLTSIVGRAVVVHSGTDDLGRGDNEESLKTGNAGSRAACGVIGLA